MAHPKSIPTSWVVRQKVSDGTFLPNLKPFEFGIFDEDTHESLTPAQVQKRRKVYFAVGSPNQKQFTQGTKTERLFNPNNSDVTPISELIPTSKVDVIRYQVPVKTENPNVYYLGYSGVASGVCNTLKFECGKTYMFHVEMKGRPVRNIFPGEFREIIEFTTDCCDSCTQTSCDTGDDCGKHIDRLVDNFNKSLWVSRFFKASKVLSCAEDPAELTRTTFNKFVLTVCDNGDELALSNVQLQYPTLKVTKVSRKAPYTTYEVIKTGSAPSAFTQTNVRFVDECGNCPSGYTEVAAGNAYLVTVDRGIYDTTFDTDEQTTLDIILDTTIGADGSVTQVGDTGATLVFYVVMNNTTPGTVLDGAIVTSLGTVPATCTSSTVTTTWLANGTCYKVQRDLQLLLGADVCDDPEAAQNDLIAEAQAFYTGLEDYVAGSLDTTADTGNTDCVIGLTLSQYNTEYLEDDCDTSPNPVFREMTPFKGQRWVVNPCEGWTVNEDTGCPVPPAASTNCCQCGIKFETLPTTQLLDNFAGFDFATYLEKEQVEMTVTLYKDDVDMNICDYASPSWLHAKKASFRQLRGDDVVKRIITERFYKQEPWINQVNKEGMLFLQREGIKLGVNLDDFYYAIDVYFNEDRNQNNTASHNNTRHCITLFVNENDATTVSALRQHLSVAFPDAKLENWI